MLNLKKLFSDAEKKNEVENLNMNAAADYSVNVGETVC